MCQMFSIKSLSMDSSTKETQGLEIDSLNAKQSGEELLDGIVV